MNHHTLQSSRALHRTLAALALAMGAGLAAAGELSLSGDNEVPPVKSAGAGHGMIAVAADGTVSGSIKTTGIAGTMAHIHVGAAGKNGPVAIPLTKGEDGTFTVPAGAKLDEEQQKRFKAGELYVNVHTAENKGGEIRAQLAP
jgi:hypothetical protein